MTSMDSDQGKLFVGGISWDTTEEKLKDYFSAYGHVVESVIMKDRATGRARGFGFVAFADPAVADRVLQEKHTIDGRTVEAKKAVPRDEQQNFPRSSNGGSASPGLSRTKKIFVGGLASSVTEEDFRNYFAQFGSITDVVVMYDHNTQRPRGFGFITFDSEDAVEKVVQKTFHELHEKMVEVKKAIPKELGRSAPSGFPPGSVAGRGTPYNSGYGQGYNSSPSNVYGATRYAPPPGGRGGFSPYGPAYGAPGYAVSNGYGVAMNGGYGVSGYGGVAGYPAAGGYNGGYGSAPTATGYGGGPGYGAASTPSAGFVSTPVGPRSPWGNAGTGYGGGGSPAAYGVGAAPGMNGYGTTGWPSSGAGGQSPGGAAAYANGGYGYAGYSTNAGGYQARSAAGGPVNYSDSYAVAQPYGDSAWRSGASHGSPSTSGAPAGAGYGKPANGVGMISGAGGTGVGSSTDVSGYGVAGRQMQRGPDARFRPYPAAGVAAQS